MKTRKKKILGLLGLFLVAAVTAFAAFMPQQRASATYSQSISDELQVRIVGEVPRVAFTTPVSGTKFTTPQQALTFDYENVDHIQLRLTYKGENGAERTKALDDFYVDYQAGTRIYPLNLDDYGYGVFQARVSGSHLDIENAVEDVIEFSYGAVDSNLGDGKTEYDEEHPLTSDPVIDLGVDPEDTRIGHVTLCVYYGKGTDGKPVEDMCPLEVNAPFDDVVLPFGEQGLPSGWYTVDIQAYDGNDDLLDEEILTFYYKLVENNQAQPPHTSGPSSPSSPSPESPDTGGAPFADLSVSRQDYLLTGLIVFLIAAVGGVVIVLSKRASKKR